MEIDERCARKRPGSMSDRRGSSLAPFAACQWAMMSFCADVRPLNRDRLFMFSHPRGDLIESGVAEFDSAIKSRHYKKLTITAKKLSLRLRNIPIMKYSTSLRQAFVTISALSQAPSAWPTWTACEHSLAQPSDSRMAVPTSHDTLRESCRIWREGGASAT